MNLSSAGFAAGGGVLASSVKSLAEISRRLPSSLRAPFAPSSGNVGRFSADFARGAGAGSLTSRPAALSAAAWTTGAAAFGGALALALDRDFAAAVPALATKPTITRAAV